MGGFVKPTTTMKTKEELKEELRQIEEREHNEFIEKHYPRFKALKGKCFKMRSSYSDPERESDYWFVYVKIQKIEKRNMYKSMGGGALSSFNGWSFQTDKYGKISIDFNYEGYVSCITEEDEISNDEFSKAWAKLQKRLTAADV